MKASDGSVRDALSLLDRALLTLDPKLELDLKSAQKIFGFFDKSQLIELFELILKGEETEVLKIYRNIYNQGVEPKVFLSDFLELIYYFKNINSLTLESTNFSLNDQEFEKIKELSKKVDTSVLVLFWQFAISFLEELNVVANQHLSMEMFLIRLMHLSSRKEEKIRNDQKDQTPLKKLENEEASQTISQIKNITQEEKINSETQAEIKSSSRILIKSLEDLIETCFKKKEIKLKYELEKNVNLVKFEKNRIEISFNENLDKNFVKELSSKLFEWTDERWIITFSKSKGEMSIKDKNLNIKKSLIENAKKSEIYKNVIDSFPDAKLIDVSINKNGEKND